MRLRMRAIEQTLQVTKAMKLISTAKLRKGRRMLEDTEPYFQRIQKSMFDILSGAKDIQSVFFRKPRVFSAPEAGAAIIVVTSDRGLAGGYNANVFRYANDLCLKVKNPVLIVIGAVGNRYFSHSPYTILEKYTFHSQMPTVTHADEIAEFIISRYLSGLLNEIHVVYTHMYSAIRLKPTERQVLPLSTEKIQNELYEIGEIKREKLSFEYLPSAEEVFDALVPQYIKGVIYGAMVEAYASEQSARLSAMDEASKNAEEILTSLQIKYNRGRQAGITQEMSEIVGGSTALADK